MADGHVTLTHPYGYYKKKSHLINKQTRKTLLEKNKKERNKNMPKTELWSETRTRTRNQHITTKHVRQFALMM